MGQFMVRLIVVLLLLAASSWGQIPNDIDSLHLILAERLSVDTAGTSGNITKTKMLHELNMGIQQVCEDFPAYEKIDTLLYTAGASSVALPADFSRAFAVYRIKNKMKLPLLPMPADQTGTIIKTKEEAQGDAQDDTNPKHFHTYKGRLILTPKYIKTATDTLEIYYYARDTWLTQGDTTVIKSKYRELALFYALSSLWADRGQYNKADYYENKYEKQKPDTPATRVEEGEL